MAREFKRRKKYKLSKENIEKKEPVRFNLTKFAKREATFLMFSTIIIMAIIIGSAFAVFSNMQRAEDFNIIRTGTLEIVFEDHNDQLGNVFNLNGAFPISDIEGMQLEPYTFNVRNIGSLPARYRIYILDDENMIDEANARDNLLSHSNIRYSIDGNHSELLSDVALTNFQVFEGYLPPGAARTHRIRVWLDYDSGNEVLGRRYHGMIRIEGEVFDGQGPGGDIVNFFTYRNANSEFSSALHRVSRIRFGNIIHIPFEGVIDEWDVSIEQDASVIAFTTVDPDNPSLFIMDIQANGYIYAPVFSTHFFYSAFSSLREFENMHFFNTKNVTGMSAMFLDMPSLQSLDLSSWDTSNVTNMSWMFESNGQLRYINLNGWDTSNVTNMSGMFYGTPVEQLDLRSFGTSSVINKNFMFGSTTSLTSVRVTNGIWRTEGVSMTGMFSDAGVSSVTFE